MKNSHSYLVPTTIKLKKELAHLICNRNSCWSKLVLEKELGNFAPSIWQVKLAPEEIRLDETKNIFQFNNAEFSFDVNIEESHETGMNYITRIPVSGKGTYALEEKKRRLKILDLEFTNY